MSVSRRQFLATAGLAGAALGTGALGAAQPAGRRLNVLYIMTDQQPASCVGAFGNPTLRTPALDELAARGCRFERFYIAGFPCSPSRASMLTGLYPHHHGVEQNDVVLDPTLPCLGNLCAAAGYDTAYFGKWHLGGNMYRDREDRRAPGLGGNWYFRRVEGADGFKFEAVEGGVGEDGPQNGFATWAGGWKDYHTWLRAQGRDDLLKAFPAVGNHNDAPSGPDDVHAFSQLPPDLHVEAFSAGRAEQFVRSHAGGRPWCVVLSFYGPHHPVAPPKPWDDMYPMEQVQLPPNHRDTLEGKPLRQFNGDTYRLPKWSDDQFKDYIRRYWGYCSYIDSQIGRVFEALRQTGQWDNTIVIFTSDHGDMLAAHGMIHKLGTCGYEELYRVPTIVHIPGVTRAGSRRSQLASNIDLLPTILEASGIPLPSKLDGKSLIPVLKDPSAPGREAIFSDCSDTTLVTRDERYKFVLNWRRRDLDELYDLQADPGEMRNLAADPAYKAQLEAQRDRVLAWTRDAGHPFAAFIAAEAAQKSTAVVMQMRPRVDAVKYLGGNEFEIEALWHVDKPIAPEGKYWCFFQFLRGNTSEITFRATPWPDPPATQWEAGRDYKVGPVKVTIPDTAPAGTYRVRVGLYDPDRKVGPGVIPGGDGNALTVGTLTVKRQGGKVSEVTFTPAQ